MFDQLSRVESLYVQYIILKIIMLMTISINLLTVSMYFPSGVYSEIYPSVEGNTKEFNFNIPFLRMIYWYIYNLQM